MTNRFWVLAACASGVFYALLCFLYRPFVADDAYIVGRYAMNAAAGRGLVYNPGEYISALTSPLHALLVLGLAWLTDDPVALYRWIAPTFPVLGWLGAIAIYRPEPREIAIVSVFALASPFMAIWAVGGLETPILAAFLTVFTAYFLKAVRTTQITTGDMLAIGVLAALAFLTRHDSVFFTLPLMASVAFVAWSRPMLWLAGAISAALAGSWLVFAQIYYGDVLPTSAYVKLHNRGVPFASIVTVLNGLVVSGAAFATLHLIGARRTYDDDVLGRAIKCGGAISAILFLIYALQNSGVHMMFSYRMFVPVLFPAAMAFASIVPGRALFLLTIQSVAQGVVAVTVLTVGMSVHVMSDFGRFGRHTPEYRNAPPVEYGAFMDTLHQDALDLVAHWRAKGINRTPRVFLYTGGTGYWMPEFYVYESLVSYRHYCSVNQRGVLGSSDYVQDMNVGPNPALRKVYEETFAGAVEYEVVSASEVYMYRPWFISYKFSAPRIGHSLPDTLDGDCDDL